MHKSVTTELIEERKIHFQWKHPHRWDEEEDVLLKKYDF